MLASLLQKKLKRLKGDKIIVVMDGGKAFLGVLKDFDDETLVLSDVCEGPASKIEWESIGEEREENTDRTFEEAYGFVDWVCVNLEEVYLRLNHVSRIWPWIHTKDKDLVKEGRKPTYTRTPAIDLLREESERMDKS